MASDQAIHHILDDAALNIPTTVRVPEGEILDDAALDIPATIGAPEGEATLDILDDAALDIPATAGAPEVLEILDDAALEDIPATIGAPEVLEILDDAALDIPATVRAPEVLAHVVRRKGGWSTLPFIIVNEILEKVGSVGLIPVCIPYLSMEYFLDIGDVSTFILVSGAAANFTPIFGALASDIYGKFRVIAVASTITLAGMLLLWSTSMVHELRPSHVCHDDGGSIHCHRGAKSWRIFLLFSSFAIMAVGAGGIRPCSPSFGADQIRNPHDPNNRRTIEAYYGWYYSSVGVSVMVSILAMSELQEYLKSEVLFIIPCALMLLALAFFIMGSSRYVKLPTKHSSLGNSIGRVIMAAWRRRRLPLPPSGHGHARWSHTQGSTLLRPTDRLSILNRACLMVPGEEVAHPVTTLITVREVEELKALLSVLPIWSTGIIITVANSPGAFPNYQAQAMDRHMGLVWQ